MAEVSPPVRMVVEEELHRLLPQFWGRCRGGRLLQEVRVQEAELISAQVVRRPGLALVVVVVAALARRLEGVQLGAGRDELLYGKGNLIVKDRNSFGK